MECSCKACVDLCQNPGWMAPDEAKRAIELGYAKRLMCDWWYRTKPIYLLCPASGWRRGKMAPGMHQIFEHTGGGLLDLIDLPKRFCKGRCTFLNKESLCGLHNSGFKPIQCRTAMGCKPEGMDNKEVADLWDNPEARALVDQWAKIVNITIEIQE